MNNCFLRCLFYKNTRDLKESLGVKFVFLLASLLHSSFFFSGSLGFNPNIRNATKYILIKYPFSSSHGGEGGGRHLCNK